MGVDDLEVKVRLTVDDSAVTPAIEATAAKLRATTMPPVKAHVDATQAKAQIATLGRDMSALSAKTVAPKVTLDGFESTRAKFAELRMQADALSAKVNAPGGVAAAATKGGFSGGILGVGAVGAAIMAPQVARALYSGTVVPAMQKATLTAATARTFGGSSEFNDAAARLQEQTGFLASDFQSAAIAGKALVNTYGMQKAQLEQLLPLAADYAATSPIEGLQTVKGSFDAIAGAIRGEKAAAQSLGLTLDDTYMTTMAANGAFKDTWSSLTDTEKAQARYTEALKQSQDLMGKSGDEDALPNKIRNMNTSLADLALKLGEEAAPAVGALADAVTRLVDAIPPWMITAAGFVIRNAPKAVETAMLAQPGSGVALRLEGAYSDIYQGVSTRRAVTAAGKDVVSGVEAFRNLSITINDRTNGGIQVQQVDPGSYAPSAR